MSAPTSATSEMPSRTFTNRSGDDDAIPGEDTSEVSRWMSTRTNTSLTKTQVTRLFAERLQAWKHAVGYLEDYITATEKTNHAHGKEYERVLKVCATCVSLLHTR